MDNTDRVLVTGASGFIGGRLVETLVNRGITVRVTTSDLRHCEHIAHLPIQIVKAGLGDHDALSDAVAGCSVVFHAAYRFGGDIEQQKVNIDGTRVLAEAFGRNGGRRFVHVSSMCAYGDPRDEDLTEDTPLRPSADPYSETKRQIDLLLLEMHRSRGFPVTIIQPTIVYGPRGTFWTTEPLQQVRSMRIALPAGGLGLCNAVYVDDVVSALTLAAERDAAVGEAFLISGSAPVTWREFYAAFEKMLGKKAVVDLDDAQLRIEERRQQKRAILGSASTPRDCQTVFTCPLQGSPSSKVSRPASQKPSCRYSWLADRCGRCMPQEPISGLRRRENCSDIILHLTWTTEWPSPPNGLAPANCSPPRPACSTPRKPCVRSLPWRGESRRQGRTCIAQSTHLPTGDILDVEIKHNLHLDGGRSGRHVRSFGRRLRWISPGKVLPFPPASAKPRQSTRE